MGMSYLDWLVVHVVVGCLRLCNPDGCWACNTLIGWLCIKLCMLWLVVCFCTILMVVGHVRHVTP